MRALPGSLERVSESDVHNAWYLRLDKRFYPRYHVVGIIYVELRDSTVWQVSDTGVFRQLVEMKVKLASSVGL